MLDSALPRLALSSFLHNKSNAGLFYPILSLMLIKVGKVTEFSPHIIYHTEVMPMVQISEKLTKEMGELET